MKKLLLLLLFLLGWSQDTINAQQSGSTLCNIPNNNIGQCIPYKDCPELVNYIKTNGSNPTSLKYLKSRQCSTGNDTRRVCCPLSIPASIDMKNCGQLNINLTAKIIGGKEAELGDYPWMVALGYRVLRQSKESLQWACAGALISPRYVLTAAHCISNRRTMQLYKVRLGVVDLNTTEEEFPQPVDVLVENTVIHEKYTGRPKVENDVALIRLKEEVSYSEYIKPICLPLQSEFRTQSMVKERTCIAGWGRISNDGPFSTILQHAQVPIVSTEDCKEAYTPLNAAVDSRNLCAGYSNGGIDSCGGDSGGPLVWRNESDQRYYTLGVVSFGHKKCATKGFPGVYTKIAEFVDFILQNIH